MFVNLLNRGHLSFPRRSDLIYPFAWGKFKKKFVCAVKLAPKSQFKYSSPENSGVACVLSLRRWSLKREPFHRSKNWYFRNNNEFSTCTFSRGKKSNIKNRRGKNDNIKHHLSSTICKITLNIRPILSNLNINENRGVEGGGVYENRRRREKEEREDR